MKNLIITLSFFLLLPFTVHANGLMKFKKVKAGEAAPKIVNRLPKSYVIEMRKALVSFMIKLEKDMESKKVSQSKGEKILKALKDQLFMAEAYAGLSGSVCFAGGWKAEIMSGQCAVPAEAKLCGVYLNKIKCDATLFGNNTCVTKKPKYANFTADCEAELQKDTNKRDEVINRLANDENKLTELEGQVGAFCTANASYDGCSTLRNQLAAARTRRTEILAQAQAAREETTTVGGAVDEAGTTTTGTETTGTTGSVASGGSQQNNSQPVVDQPAVDQPAEVESAGEISQLKIRNGGSGRAGENDGNLICAPNLIPENCVGVLALADAGTDVEVVPQTTTPQRPAFNKFKAIGDDALVNFEDPSRMARYLAGAESLSEVNPIENAINPLKVCRVIASGCSQHATKVKYEGCLQAAQSNAEIKRTVNIGFQKTIAIARAAEATTKYEAEDDYGGNPILCKGNKETRNSDGGYAFDFPRCKAFVNWFTVLSASEIGFKVGNEAAVTTAGMRNQTRLTQQIQEGNGQEAGLEAARLQAVEAKKAEERNMAFFSAKAAAIGAQLAQWVGPGNVCDAQCCKLFDAKGADRIGRDFFPNQDGKQQIIAQLIKAGADIAVAKMKADMHAQNARKVEAVKEQFQTVDESGEGVMKFCLQFPQDVRCLSPGERRALGASGTQFGSFQGSNFGLGSLEGEQASDINAGQDFGGSLAAGGPSGNVGNIGSADKDAAAAKNIFNAPAAARGGGGGGAGAGAGGGGGGGGSAQSGQLSRDEGLKEDKKESPIEITSKKAAYEGSKGGYNGGGYNPSNKKPGESPTANPFAGMFGKDKGRDPANVAEIDKPASDLFAKISRRYGEVQKRKALMEVGDEGNGIR